VPDVGTIKIDIKSKRLDLSSNPKGYNVDDMLEALSAEDSTFFYFFIGVDVRKGEIRTRLISIFDHAMLAATCVQKHWAGRNSRGTTQLNLNKTKIFSEQFQPSVDVGHAKALLEQFIKLE